MRPCYSGVVGVVNIRPGKVIIVITDAYCIPLISVSAVVYGAQLIAKAKRTFSDARDAGRYRHTRYVIAVNECIFSDACYAGFYHNIFY